MFPRLVPARRHRNPVAARMIALAGLVAIVAALAFGSVHAPGPDLPVVAGGAHSVADLAHAEAGCAGCIDHQEGAMAACLMVLMVAVVVAATRRVPTAWEARIPLREFQWAPRIVVRPSMPRLEVLCISRT